MLEIKTNSINRIDALKNKIFNLDELASIASQYNIGVSEPFIISNKLIYYLIEFNEKNLIFSSKSVQIINKLSSEDIVAFASFGYTSSYLNQRINNLWIDNERELFRNIFIDELIEIIPLNKNKLSVLNYSSAVLGAPFTSVKSINQLIEKRKTLYSNEIINGKQLISRTYEIDQHGYKSTPVWLDELTLRTFFSEHQVYQEEHNFESESSANLGIRPGLISKCFNAFLNNDIINFNNYPSIIYITKKGQDLLEGNTELINHLEHISRLLFKNKTNLSFKKEHCTKTGDYMSVWQDEYAADLILYLSYLDHRLDGTISLNWHKNNLLPINPSHAFGKYGPMKYESYFT
jgi:hypothetical protein